jgi:CHASE2 domain-containing sensor protein
MFRDLKNGLLFTLVLLVIKSGIEHLYIVELIEQSMYIYLQHHLRPEGIPNPPITIVDIGDMQPNFPKRCHKEVDAVLPREKLLEMIAIIEKNGAVAIGIDIDFAPDDCGYSDVNDPKFLQTLLDFSSSHPIFLGNARTAGEAPDHWLGAEEYESLAANTLVPKDTREMNIWFRKESVSNENRSMGAALAQAYLKFQESQEKKGIVDLPWYLRRFVRKFWLEEEKCRRFWTKKDNCEPFVARHFLVNYVSVDTLRDPQHWIAARDASELVEHSGLFSGRIVLIGEGAHSRTPDDFTVLGLADPLPGVYIHSSAANTLIQAPLYKLTGPGRFFMDLFFSGGVLLLMAYVRFYLFRGTQDEVAAHRLHIILTLGVTLAVFIVGVWLINWTHLMWDDFLLVMVVLLLHPSAERTFEAIVKWWRRPHRGIVGAMGDFFGGK